MQLQRATRKRVKVKIGIQGASGSGKTYSALLLAYGLCADWERIAVIDTENHSAELYAHLGAYQVLPLSPPFTPERFNKAIQVCMDAGAEVIVIDSVSLEWENVLEYHGGLSGNSYTNWNKVTPRHQQFIQTILQTNAHFICTLRAKQDYILSEKNGKQVPEKVGMKPIQREGFDYELTLIFELNMKHRATATKDRTGLFTNQPEFIITSETGKQIQEWCNLGEEVATTSLTTRINECTSLGELVQLFGSLTPEEQQQFQPLFTDKKAVLQQAKTTQFINSTQLSTNGTHA